MQFYYREGRLQIEPECPQERDGLLLLVEGYGLRKTEPDRPWYKNHEPLPPLDIEITTEDGKWVGKIPAFAGVEYRYGVSAEDAKHGVMIALFREIANRIERSRLLPDQVESWFAIKQTD